MTERAKRGWLGRFRRSLSLERKLPRLILGVLAVALAVTLALTYGTRADAARDVAAERLARAGLQFATSIEASVN